MATALVLGSRSLLRGWSGWDSVARLPLDGGRWDVLPAKVLKHQQRWHRAMQRKNGPGNQTFQTLGQQTKRGGFIRRGQGPSERSSQLARQQTVQGALKRVKAKATVRSVKLSEKSKREAAAAALPIAVGEEAEELLNWQTVEAKQSSSSASMDLDLVERDELEIDECTLASPYLLFDPPSSSTRKVAARRSSMFAGGAFGFSQRIVVGVLCALVLVGGVVATDLGIEAAQDWWDHTNLIQRSAPFYMISLLPYLDFLWKLQQSRPQATKAMVFSFAFVLVFVVISTPVEMYSRVHLGRDVADVDPLHFLVQSLIALTNFMIILAFRNEIRRKKEEARTKGQLTAQAQPSQGDQQKGQRR